MSGIRAIRLAPWFTVPYARWCGREGHEAFPYPNGLVSTMFAGNKAVQFFYVMSENHIGLDKFTAFCHAGFSMLLPFARLLKTFTNAFGHGVRQDINQFIHRSACQSLVGKGHRGVYRYTRFQTRIGRSFTGTMNANERFEEVHISQFFGLGAFGTNRKSLFKSSSDFLLIFYLNPFEYWCYVTLLKS